MFGKYFQKKSSLKKHKKLALFAALACLLPALLLSFFTACDNSRSFTLDDSGASTVVQQGNIIEIKLESNPTTGYGWVLSDEYDKTIISLVSTEYKQSKSGENLIGAGGYEYFYFKADSRGETGLVLNYTRPWEEGVDPINVFKMDISVE